MLPNVITRRIKAEVADIPGFTRRIRRFLPKGTTFDKLRQRDVQRLALWMNKNPRKILIMHFFTKCRI